jgi:hypothetical protein
MSIVLKDKRIVSGPHCFAGSILFINKMGILSFELEGAQHTLECDFLDFRDEFVAIHVVDDDGEVIIICPANKLYKDGTKSLHLYHIDRSVITHPRMERIPMGNNEGITHVQLIHYENRKIIFVGHEEMGDRDRVLLFELSGGKLLPISIISNIPTTYRNVFSSVIKDGKINLFFVDSVNKVVQSLIIDDLSSGTTHFEYYSPCVVRIYQERDGTEPLDLHIFSFLHGKEPVGERILRAIVPSSIANNPHYPVYLGSVNDELRVFKIERSTPPFLLFVTDAGRYSFVPIPMKVKEIHMNGGIISIVEDINDERNIFRLPGSIIHNHYVLDFSLRSRCIEYIRNADMEDFDLSILPNELRELCEVFDE